MDKCDKVQVNNQKQLAINNAQLKMLNNGGYGDCADPITVKPEWCTEEVLDRSMVHAFEDIMKKNVPTAKEAAIIARMTVKHYWSYGIYGRELFLPKDVMIAGEIHKYPNMNIICNGDISIFIDGQIKRVQAPYIFVAPAGSKRIAYAHEDTVWFMPHRTDEVDVDKIENFFVAHTEDEYIEFVESNKQQLVLPI
jgi:hypothetical protein